MGRKIYKNFKLFTKFNLDTLILFELFHKGIFVVLILPIIKFLFEKAMQSVGIVYLSTDNVFKFLSNPIAIILLIVLLLTLIFYMFFEFAAVIICFDKSIELKKISILPLVKEGLRKSKIILYPRNLILMVFVLLIIPLTNLTLTSGVIGEIRLPDYILDFIKSDNILNLIYILVMFILYTVVIRWIFVIHEMIINEFDFKEARNASKVIVKGNEIKILFYTIGTFLIWSLLCVVFYYFMIGIIGVLVKNFGRGNSIKEIFILRSKLFREYSLLASSILSFIVNLGLITALYYAYKRVDFDKKKAFVKKKVTFKAVIKWIVIILLIQVESLVLIANKEPVYNLEFMYNTTATAHRGAALVAPENTITSFKESIKSDVEYIETDVQETKDGELILLHDSNFKRTTGVDKNVWNVYYEEVKTYDAGSYFGSEYAGEKIPTLDEAIKAVRGRAKLMVEIKFNGHESDDFVEKVIKVIKDNNYENQCVIASMNKEVLKRVKELEPGLVTCYITALAYGDFYKWDYVNIFSVESTFISQSAVKDIHNMGKQIFAWTINDEALMGKMIDMNVDSIVTDDPFLVQDTVYWKKNDFINKAAEFFFD
ncbi:MAG: glycerophosphodiester phosphodiesterase [Clostridium sp.]